MFSIQTLNHKSISIFLLIGLVTILHIQACTCRNSKAPTHKHPKIKATFSNLTDQQVFHDQISFSVKNLADELNTDDLEIELICIDQLICKLGKLEAEKIQANLTSLLGKQSSIAKEGLSAPITLTVINPKGKNTSKITLKLTNKQGNQLDTKVLIWKANAPLSLTNVSSNLVGSSQPNRTITFKITKTNSTEPENGKLSLRLVREPASSDVRITSLSGRNIQIKEIDGKQTYEITLNNHELEKDIKDLVIDHQGNLNNRYANFTVQLVYDGEVIGVPEAIEWNLTNIYLQYMTKDEATFEEKVEIRLSNAGETINTRDIIVKLVSTDGVVFKLGNKQGDQLTTSLQDILGISQLSKDQKVNLPIELAHANNKITANITLTIHDATGTVIQDQLFTWKITNDIGETPLHQAVEQGDLNQVQELIKKFKEKDISLDIEGDGWGSPLHIAALKGYTGIAKLLIDNNADINIHNKHYTPLHLAINSLHTETAKLLINNHASLDIPESHYGFTPLHAASRKNLPEIVQLLIDKQATLNAQDENGRTSLYLASMFAAIESASLLISNHADFNIQDNKGRTPLHVIAQGGMPGLLRNNKLEILKQIAETLADAGADLNLQDEDGNTPLHLAVINNQIDIVKTLLAHHANMNIQDKQHRTPLHMAIISGFPEIAKMLIDSHANLDTPDKMLRTPLHWAARMGAMNQVQSLEIVKALINAGAALNLQDEAGDTPLHLAVMAYYIEIAKLLKEEEAQLDIKNKNGKSPIELAGTADMQAIFN
ncbi:MAG: hypothetical protein BGO68_05280 [Candidatus Amoebophilus sp. 36-38]|nr:MAG: hypothetical protein BGO68_05280 [Candidatus Amoebophilus sp. 36-38]